MPHQDQTLVDLVDAAVVSPTGTVRADQPFTLTVDATFENHATRTVSGGEWAVVAGGREVIGNAPTLAAGEQHTVSLDVRFDPPRTSPNLPVDSVVPVDAVAVGTGHSVSAGELTIGPSRADGDGLGPVLVGAAILLIAVLLS